MDKKEFDETYLSQTLEGVVYKVRRFRDLDLPKIRVSLPQGYAHTPDEELIGVIRFLDRCVEKGFITFENIKENRGADYRTIRIAMIRIEEQCRYPLK